MDNKRINPKYLLPVKKGVIAGFCSSGCIGKFRRNVRAYASKIPGLIPASSKAKGGKPAAPMTAAAMRKSWSGPCDLKKMVKGYYCGECKRDLEQFDTRNGICKRCEKTPTKIDFCAVQLEIIFRAECHPSKTSDKPFRC